MLGAYPQVVGDAQREFAATVLRFARAELDDGSIRDRDVDGTFWREGWDRCAALGLCGLPVPQNLGGSGADRVTTAAALEALGYGCSDAGLVFSLSAHLWTTAVPLTRFGTPDQHDRFLRPVAEGRMIGLHAMTEPDSGSDAFALRTVARPNGGGYILEGRKALITNAPVADLFTVFARAPGSEGALGVTAFLVEAGTPGLIVGQPTEKLGLRTSPMAEVTIDGVRVGDDAVLGRPGRGAEVFTTSMEWERALIMAGPLGALARSVEEASEYARTRQQFGQPIARFQAVADRVVDTRVRLDAARALLFDVAARYDRGEAHGAVAAASVKLVASEAVVAGALALLQVHGGYGYTEDLPFERRLRDALGAPLYSGTSDMMRRIIARGMGL